MAPGAHRGPGRIVLVGLSGAGKSTVGRALAERLDFDLLDLDDEIERLAGRSIREIFRERGEAGFRELEARASRGLSARDRIVIATGGGWMSRHDPGSWEDTVSVWLQVRPETAARRLAEAVHARPMLDRATPLESLTRLLDARRADYARADVAVLTEGRSPAEVVDHVLKQIDASRLTGDEIGSPPTSRAPAAAGCLEGDATDPPEPETREGTKAPECSS